MYYIYVLKNRYANKKISKFKINEQKMLDVGGICLQQMWLVCCFSLTMSHFVLWVMKYNSFWTKKMLN